MSIMMLVGVALCKLLLPFLRRVCYHVELMFLPNICFLLLGRRIICKKSLIHESTNNAVEILTDARRCWRRSFRQTDVVCLNNKNKKEIAYGVATSVDNACAMCHELLGTKRIYEKKLLKAITLTA